LFSVQFIVAAAPPPTKPQAPNSQLARITFQFSSTAGDPFLCTWARARVTSAPSPFSAVDPTSSHRLRSKRSEPVHRRRPPPTVDAPANPPSPALLATTLSEPDTVDLNPSLTAAPKLSTARASLFQAAIYTVKLLCRVHRFQLCPNRCCCSLSPLGTASLLSLKSSPSSSYCFSPPFN
jgi:hypothetical protein